MVVVSRGTRRSFVPRGSRGGGSLRSPAVTGGWDSQLCFSCEHHRFTSGILGGKGNRKLISHGWLRCPTTPANQPAPLPCLSLLVPRRPLPPRLPGHSPVELEGRVLPVTPQFLHTLLALPRLLCLGRGGQGVTVGPQDADCGGGEVREGLLALLLPPTALLPRVTPAFLITVPALERGDG